MYEDFFEKVHKVGLVPVVKIDDANKAEGLAQALIDGGLPCAEVTFRTDAAEEAIKRIATKFPQMLVGAGTVINVELAKKAVAAGATYIVSPGFNPSVVDWCIEHKIPVVPGVCTPSDIEQGLARNLSVLKFFPAEASGGVNMLKNFAGPFPQLKFMPTGGIGLDNLSDYAKQPNVLAVGGSWMVKADLIDNEQWDVISDICKKAVVALQGISFAHFSIDNEDEAKAEEVINALSVFGMDTKRGNSSTFMGGIFEVLPRIFRGARGHFAFKCFDIERTLSYLSDKGFTADEASIVRDGKGKIKVVYLQQEIGGFAVHLIKA